MKPLDGYIFVSVKQKLSDTIKYGTLELYIDPAFKPEFHSPVTGIVEGVHDGIDDNIKVGRRIYFDYKSVGPDEQEFMVNGKVVYIIPVYFLLCVIVDGEVKMLGDRVFCNSIEVEGSEESECEGIIRKSATGIIEAINLKHDLEKAKVAFIGENDLGISNGDVIYYEKASDDEYEIEGKKYFVMRQENLELKEV